MYRLIIITALMTLIYGGGSAHLLHADTPTNAPKVSWSLQDIEKLIERYGKRPLIKFILNNNSRQITLHIGNETKPFYGAPNPDYVNAHTIRIDLSQMGTTAPALNKALALARQVKPTIAITPTSNRPPTLRTQSADAVTFTKEGMCKAAIAIVMGRDPEIMTIDRMRGEVLYLSYVRQDDRTKWKYKCKLDGNRIIWGADDGRWRTHPADSIITYEVKGQTLHVKERFADGSAKMKSFTQIQLRS